MAGGNIDDDEYVAQLLKEDAKSTVKKYEMVGLDAFLPQRSRNGAPKPNTDFLRNIIRQTDNHNAALLAKEAEESRARLKEMNREREKEVKTREREHERQHKNRGDTKRKRSTYSDEDEEKDSRRRRRHREDESRDSRSRRDRERDRDRRREKGRREASGDDSPKRMSRHSKRNHEKERRHKDDSDECCRQSRRREDSSRRHRRRRSHSRSSSPAPRTHRRYKLSGRRNNSLSPVPTSESPERSERRRTKPKSTEGAKHSKHYSPAPDSDSDPLEALVGPLPPRTQPAVRPRGRGAHKANSNAMDARFSTTYNPSTDVHIKSDIEDDWGDALETLKDRERWKQQGAERLKAVGFSDEQVKKWKKGDEKTEEDVTWAKRGEGREWDRGKVVDEDGHVDLKADWGRLK
ncbi:hypothetical protein K505DRAFT_422678 [Melanomma pulvis-pyrius CBS 109.77]|uniref:Pre-mRNA-splicing factor 38B n=1 Tax=Melanomma pulvis-pyrius CBS 109.77 TaxID=1314802 RepID=A0A6A6WQ67_9PLEO|nr:hypothetical protein K505DRAFT_422678 [Melanomma pulvis-pyrius CBS 109.77]